MSLREALPVCAYGTATLGAVIDALKRCDPGQQVQFDFCYLSPTSVHSYRGRYEQLALGWTAAETPQFDGEYWPKVSALLTELEAAVGKDFQGWKGGSYTMSRHTPLWVDNPGNGSDTGVVAVERGGAYVILVTAKVD